MLSGPVEAGTVLHFDFDDLDGCFPEMTGKHPCISVRPKHRQKDGILWVVPLTSSVQNFNNPDAVEIFNTAFNRISPTGRTFAICNIVCPISMTRPSLDYYEEGRNATRETNRRPKYRIAGRDLALVRTAVARQLWDDAEYRRILNGHYGSLWDWLKERLGKSKTLGRTRAGRKAKSASGETMAE